MVDVPDPPKIEEPPEDENSSSDEVFDIEREKSPTPAKIHHLFVKVPPKQTAKFERMVRRNRTLEHEVKVYHELLRDLQTFITERLPRNPIQLNIPKLYHGFTETTETSEEGTKTLLGTSPTFNVRDQSVLVIEDLAEKGFSSKDRDNATRAIMHLTNESENRKIMCNKVVLQALLKACNFDGPEDTETRDSALVAIERLATEASNRQYMSRHDGLLVAIAKATERESKSELAGEKNSQPRLAKQLLMSLLLAM